MKNTATIILAAGEGTRMRSSLPKVLHNICGKPMLGYLIDNVNSIGIKKVIVIVGHKAELVKKQISGIKCVVQDELLGTGDAVSKARSALLKDSKIENVLILYGDTPLLSQGIIKKIVETHTSSGAGATLLTAQLKNPTGYGRVIRSAGKKVVKIVEELDASIYEKITEEINVGVYCFNKKALFDSLEKIKPNNEKEEYYLTDTIEVLTKANIPVESVTTADAEEFLGVNTRVELGKAELVMRKRILNKIMDAGVTIIDPDNTYIGHEVEIKEDTVIYPYTFIENNVKIGSNCSVGPFARLRPGTVIGDKVGIGNFVEIVRSCVGQETKIRHQCYIGDTVIGRNVNIGAGTIVANYNGKEKHKTIIEDNAFIGTGTILIAPVKIGKGAITGAGSVVTRNKNVPAGKTVIGIPAKPLDKVKKQS